MEDSKAVAFYDDQRSRGSGAAKFKHGLGFSARPPPALQTAPDSFATRPNGPPPMLRAPLPSQRPTMVAQYMQSCGPQPPFYPPVAYPPPPGPYSPHTVLSPRIGLPMMPPRPPTRPPQGMPFYPSPQVLSGQDAWQPVPPPRPPLGPPPPTSTRAAGATATGTSWPQSTQMTSLSFSSSEGKHNGLTSGRLSEGSIPKKTEHFQKIDGDIKKRKEDQSWSAHRADDGAVYYYNTFTNKSSWEKPEGFLGDNGCVTETPKPVASARIKGCDWTEVKCADGRKYFFHILTQETLWSEPPEVTRIKAAEEEATRIQNVPQQPRSVPVAPPKPVVLKHSRSTPPPKKTPAPKPQQLTEETIAKFKALLEEKGINPFSCFERELPKLEHDERWKDVPLLKDRRVFFDEYCRSLAEKQRQSKEDATKAAADGFLDLLDAIAEHEVVQHAERKRRKAADREEGEMETGYSSEEPEVSTTGFLPKTTMELLETLWGNDERWKACSPRTRKRLFEERRGPVQQTQREARHKETADAEENFRTMLQEHKVGSSSRWSKVRGILLHDDRYTAVVHSDREELFRKYVEETKAFEEQDRRKQREQLAREREIRVRMERDEEEAERRKHRAAHCDAVAGFRTLLGEVVKDPDAMWRDWKNKLARDSQGRATNLALESRELERLFRDHVKELMDAANRDYRELLKEVIRPLFPSKEKHSQVKSSRDRHPALCSFESAQDLLQDDSRFQRTPRGIRERLWRRFVEDVFLEYAPSSARGGSDRLDKHSRNREAMGYRQKSQDWQTERDRRRLNVRIRGRERTDRRTYYREREEGQERKRSRA